MLKLNQRGQAMLEYVLIIIFAVGLYSYFSDDISSLLRSEKKFFSVGQLALIETPDKLQDLSLLAPPANWQPPNVLHGELGSNDVIYIIRASDITWNQIQQSYKLSDKLKYTSDDTSHYVLNTPVYSLDGLDISNKKFRITVNAPDKYSPSEYKLQISYFKTYDEANNFSLLKSANNNSGNSTDTAMSDTFYLYDLINKNSPSDESIPSNSNYMIISLRKTSELLTLDATDEANISAIVDNYLGFTITNK